MATALAEISSVAPVRNVSARRRLITGRILVYAALVVAVILVLFPIYWMIVTIDDTMALLRMASRNFPSASSLVKLSRVNVFGHSEGTR